MRRKLIVVASWKRRHLENKVPANVLICRGNGDDALRVVRYRRRARGTRDISMPQVASAKRQSGRSDALTRGAVRGERTQEEPCASVAWSRLPRAERHGADDPKGYVLSAAASLAVTLALPFTTTSGTSTTILPLVAMDQPARRDERIPTGGGDVAAWFWAPAGVGPH
ncbi:MAG: hypothetical protein WCG47_14145, partial [Dermatophilaceae bacterium]